jgi:FixJ family two-component response regulator
MATPRATIAVVEDDAGVRTALQQLLRSAGFEAIAFASAEELLAAEAVSDVDCVIADVNLPGMSGVALAGALAERGVTLATVLMTGRDDPTTRKLVRQGGAVPCLHKPFSDRALFDAIEQVMHRQRHPLDHP